MDNLLVIFDCNNKCKNSSALRYMLDYFERISSEMIILGDDIPCELSSYKNISDLRLFSDIKKFKQIIFLKDEFYGPFSDIDKIFEKMSEFDFWAFDNIFLKTKSFIIFNQNIIQDANFTDILLADNFYETFQKQGYSIGLFSDDTFMIDKKILIEKQPVLHKSYLYKEGYKLYNYRVKKVFDYLKNELCFDTDLILEDMILNGNAHLIPKNIHLNYLLQNDLSEYDISDKKIALIMFIHPEELAQECCEYANNMPLGVDIFVVSTSDSVINECKKYFSKINNKVIYRTQQNRGRDNTALLITCSDVLQKYDYVCFVHAKQALHRDSKTFGEDFRYHCFSSLLQSKGYINNVIKTLDENKFLGILAPFPPNFQPYVAIGDEWMQNFGNAKEFIKKRIDADINLPKDNPICVFGGMFWAKSSALKTLVSLNLTFEDFPEEPLDDFDGLLTHAIERIIPALAQNDGYYTSFVAPLDYGIIYLDNIMNDFKLIRKAFLQKYDEK